jgi:large subunit ribosomal protein L21
LTDVDTTATRHSTGQGIRNAPLDGAARRLAHGRVGVLTGLCATPYHGAWRTRVRRLTCPPAGGDGWPGPRRSEPDNESESAVYAIVRSGGLQQKVAVGDVIEIDRVPTSVGDNVSLPAVLVVDGDTVTSDTAALAKVAVTAEVLGETKGPKINILKYKNKTGYRRRQGHRQRYTQVKVTGIDTK